MTDDEVERSAALYDKETEEKLAAEKVNPIPKSTYLKDLYSDFIEEELDTMRHHQEQISLFISLKEGEAKGSRIRQMCDVYLVETRIYLEKSIEDLKGLRESYEICNQFRNK